MLYDWAEDESEEPKKIPPRGLEFRVIFLAMVVGTEEPRAEDLLPGRQLTASDATPVNALQNSGQVTLPTGCCQTLHA